MQLADENIDILCITETWLTADINTNFINIDGYECFRQDRTNKTHARTIGGGICISVKQEYSSNIIKNLENDTIVEDLLVNIQVRKNKSFIVGILYRPPKANSFRYIESNLRYMLSLNKNIYVLGDFNDDQLKSNTIKNILSRLNLKQLITEPTRITNES